MSRGRGRVVYGLCVGAFVVVALELLLRAVSADPEYYWNFNFSFVSPKVIENRGDGLWTYRPHAAIREVSVYATASLIPPRPRFVVEYDCRMRSNNLGLLQGADVAPGTGVTLIVGDSFAAGEGGCPWFDRLQSRRPNERLLNGGLLGTGFEQWRRLVVHLRQNGVVIERLLVVGISNDLKREPWNWPARQLACLDDNRCPPDTESGLWQPVADDESAARVIERTATRYAQRYPDPGTLDFLYMYLRRYSYLYKFVDRAVINLKAKRKGTAPQQIGIRSDNVAALDQLKALGTPFHVLMVTQRDELGLWGLNADSAAAVAILTAHAVPFGWCRLAAGDYMPNDGHPNRAGYDKLVACADAALDRMERSAGPRS